MPQKRLVAGAAGHGYSTFRGPIVPKSSKTPNEHSAGVHSAAHMPVGETLVTGSSDDTVRLWGIPD